jgi:hypothetical protein
MGHDMLLEQLQKNVNTTPKKNFLEKNEKKGSPTDPVNVPQSFCDANFVPPTAHICGSLRCPQSSAGSCMHAMVVAGLWASLPPACPRVSAWPHRAYLAVLLCVYLHEMDNPTNGIGDSY